MKTERLQKIFPNLAFARYNLAAWQKSDSDSICFIGREVTEAGAEGEPDTGTLKLFEVSPDGDIVYERTIWAPTYDGINLEDPRALELKDGNLIIGLTAVLRNKSGGPVAFPAIIKIDSPGSWQQELPPFLFIGSFGPGKNLTPLDGTTYLFRPDTPEYRHKILVFSLHRQVPEKIGDIVFPTTLPWAQWKIGTTMPPIWFNQNEALFIIHGISIENIDGRDKYVYRLGRAKLTREDNVFTVTVAPEPILTPDDFKTADGEPLVSELHPDLRRALYLCGGLIKRDRPDALSLYASVGDRTTFEVKFPLAELKEGLF